MDSVPASENRYRPPLPSLVRNRKSAEGSDSRAPTPKDKADANLIFITKYGHRWVRTTGEKNAPIDAVLNEFGKLLRAPRCPHCGSLQADATPAKCTACKRKPAKGQTWGKLKRAGLGFYALRHTFRTVADATKDFPAIRLIMGHADASIDDVYREKITIAGCGPLSITFAVGCLLSRNPSGGRCSAQRRPSQTKSRKGLGVD